MDDMVDSKISQLRHGQLLPSTIRCIICGPSNCGKTNVMFSLLTDLNGLKFENVYIYSKSLYQPKYQVLEKISEQVKGLGFFTFSDNAEIMEPSMARKNSIFIFDDVLTDKQNSIRDYFAMGRHSLVDSFYLCQSYAKIPKHLIRDNANMLVLFKQDGTNMKHIYDDHVNTDMSFDEFTSMCNLCWKDKYGFLVLAKDFDIEKGRYRKGFDCFIKK